MSLRHEVEYNEVKEPASRVCLVPAVGVEKLVVDRGPAKCEFYPLSAGRNVFSVDIFFM